ncbi:MAG: hypothetical protein ACP5N1_00315 [Candidatus Woesearchaeota archaeon]
MADMDMYFIKETLRKQIANNRLLQEEIVGMNKLLLEIINSTPEIKNKVAKDTEQSIKRILTTNTSNVEKNIEIQEKSLNSIKS